MLTDEQRRVFDDLLEQIMDNLPEQYARVIEHVSVVVDDEPTRDLLVELGMDPDEDDLCGLHTGTPLTERSVDDLPDVPDQIMLFRGPIMRLAGWSNPRSDDSRLQELREQVRITLLHELGHHYGLEEDDLDELGYA